MKIAENDFKLDIRLIIFAFGTFEGISFLTPSKTGFIFGLIPHEPLIVQKPTIPHIKASILSYFEPEEQGCDINIGAPRPFPIKSILSRKSGPIEGA